MSLMGTSMNSNGCKVWSVVAARPAAATSSHVSFAVSRRSTETLPRLKVRRISSTSTGTLVVGLHQALRQTTEEVGLRSRSCRLKAPSGREVDDIARRDDHERDERECVLGSAIVKV